MPDYTVSCKWHHRYSTLRSVEYICDGNKAKRLNVCRDASYYGIFRIVTAKDKGIFVTSMITHLNNRS